MLQKKVECTKCGDCYPPGWPHTCQDKTVADTPIVCNVCGGYNYELLGCCDGRECGCMGQPVDSKPCSKCNSDGKNKPSLQAQKDWPWFFLTEEEWNKRQK